MEDMLTTEYDGCGRCLVAVRRLSRKTDKTSSPQRQGDQDLQAAADAGGHIIAWADDWEVSGATDPMTRKGLGPVAARARWDRMTGSWPRPWTGWAATCGTR